MEYFILQLRLRIMELMLQILRLQTGKIRNPDKRLALYEVARANIGKDVSPADLADDDVGCAESVNMIFEKAFGRQIGGSVSTYRMYSILRSDARFQRVLTPLPGDVVISPTGYGNGNLKNGHVGIVSDKGMIMSNYSITGKWLEFYSLESWKERYVTIGGFPMAFFRVV